MRIVHQRSSFEQDYLDWYHAEQGTPYDPNALVHAAPQLEAKVPGLTAALRRCTVRYGRRELYHHFLPAVERAPCLGRMLTCVLHVEDLGRVLVDVLLAPDRHVLLVYGAEYLEAVFAYHAALRYCR
jgi:hypothetical protein